MQHIDQAVYEQHQTAMENLESLKAYAPWQASEFPEWDARAEARRDEHRQRLTHDRADGGNRRPRQRTSVQRRAGRDCAPRLVLAMGVRARRPMDRGRAWLVEDIGVDGSVDETKAAQWNDAPGIKWLVIGNHDVDPLNPLNALVIDRTDATLAAPGNPSLVLTHVPLRRVPAGWVNVHGHIHQERSPTDERHINVSVEQLDYRPARMSDIRRLARRLVKGRSVPGETTRVRLDLVEHAMT